MTQTEGSMVTSEDPDCCGLSQNIRSKTVLPRSLTVTVRDVIEETNPGSPQRTWRSSQEVRRSRGDIKECQVGIR